MGMALCCCADLYCAALQAALRIITTMALAAQQQHVPAGEQAAARTAGQPAAQHSGSGAASERGAGAEQGMYRLPAGLAAALSCAGACVNARPHRAAHVLLAVVQALASHEVCTGTPCLK